MYFWDKHGVIMMLGWMCFLPCAFKFTAWTGLPIEIWFAEFAILGVLGIIGLCAPDNGYVDWHWARDVLFCSLCAWCLLGRQTTTNSLYWVIGGVIATMYLFMFFLLDLSYQIWECHLRIRVERESFDDRAKQLANSIDRVREQSETAVFLAKQERERLDALSDELHNNLMNILTQIKTNERQYKLLMMPLSECTLFKGGKNKRLFNALRKNEILSVFLLCQYGRNDLLQLDGVGRRGVLLLEKWCETNRLRLGSDVYEVVEKHDVFSKLLK